MPEEEVANVTLVTLNSFRSDEIIDLILDKVIKMQALCN